MQKKKTILITSIALFSLLTTNSFSQSAINVAGGSATIQGMKFDYSIGEMTIVSTERNAHLIVTQGLLQPTSSGSGASENPSPTHTLNADYVKVYPNPTSNLLYVESYQEVNSKISYQLFDATGKLVLSKEENLQAGSNKITFDMQSYAAGAYYLMIKEVDAENSTLSFKILKTN